MNERLENERILKLNKEKEYQEILLLKAIDNNRWSELNQFNRSILKSCVDFNDFENLKRYYKQKLSASNYSNLFDAMKALGKKDLLQLSYKDNRISDYYFHPKLKIHFVLTYNEIGKHDGNQTYYLNHKPKSNELKFMLTVNDISSHPDKPKFAGSIKFSKDIVLVPGIKYTFGMWERVNNQMYLTLVPTDNIINTPIQKRLSQEPVHIQEAINNYFDKINRE